MSQLLKTGFLYVFCSSIVNKVIGFMSTAILVRILTKTEYGIFTYCWNIYCITVLFSGFGMAFSVLQLCSEKSHNIEYCRAVYGYGKKIGIYINMILFVVIIGIALFIPLQISGAKMMIICLSLLPEVQFQYDVQTAYIRAQKNNRVYGFLSILNAVLVLVTSVIGGYFGRELGLVLGRYIAFLVTHFVAIKLSVIPTEKVNLGELDYIEKKSMWYIGGISMINSGLSQLMYLLDVFIIGIVISQETIIATYSVATIIPAALSFIPTAVVIYIFPYFAENKNDKKWCMNSYKKVLVGIGAFNFIVLIVLYIEAPFIIKLVFGVNYLDALIPFRILVISYFFSGTFRTIAGNLLVTQRKLRYNTFVAVLSGALNIIIDYFMIKIWGINGAAVATLSVVVLTSFLNVLYLVHVLRKN